MNKKHWSLVLAFVLVAVVVLGCGGGAPAADGKHPLIGKYQAVKMSVGDMELSLDDLGEEEPMIMEILEDGTVTMDGEGGAAWKADGDKVVITGTEAEEDDLNGIFAKGEEDFYNLTITDEEMGEMAIIFVEVE